MHSETSVEASPSLQLVADRELALMRYHSINARKEITQVRLACHRNSTAIGIIYKSYHPPTGRLLNHSCTVVVNDDSGDDAAAARDQCNMYACHPQIGHESEFVAFSRDGSMVARLCEERNGHQYLTVVAVDEGVIFGMNVSKNEMFSKIYKPENELGTFEWSPDGQRIVMLVRPGPAPPADGPNPTTFSSVLNDRRFADHARAGEGLSDIEDFKIAILEIPTGVVTFVDTPDLLIPSQFSWAADNLTFFFVGVRCDMTGRLGLRYCTNRPSSIYQVRCADYNNPRGQWLLAQFLDGARYSVSLHSPRVAPNGRYMVYTKNDAYGPHNHCRGIWITEMMNAHASEELLVENVEYRSPHHLVHLPQTYLGLYEDLPEMCWTGDSKYIIFHAGNGFYRYMYILAVCPGKILPQRLFKIEAPVLTNDSSTCSTGCWTVRCVSGSKIVATYSSCSRACCLWLGSITENPPENDCPITISWQIISEEEPYFEGISLSGSLLSNEITHPLTSEIGHPIFEGLKEESFLVRATVASVHAPTIVCVHGGPNSAFQDEFSELSMTLYTFAACGFNVLLLNYVGSTGYGQNGLNYLTGHILDRDVDSCVRMLNQATTQHKLNKGLLLYYGGSHGGAIGLYLMAKYPELFAAAVLRNPVCDYNNMLTGSDIPDYLLSQLLGSGYDPKFKVTFEMVESLWKKSPIRNANEIKTPLLLLLGSKDMRVPYQPSLRLKQFLDSRNVPCDVRIYPTGHAIKGFYHLQDSFVQTYNWFVRFAERRLTSAERILD